jgi:hypothetical protein
MTNTSPLAVIRTSIRPKPANLEQAVDSASESGQIFQNSIGSGAAAAFLIPHFLR